jgi:hypothetical protein
MGTKINSRPTTRICTFSVRQLHRRKAYTQKWPTDGDSLFGKVTFKKLTVLQIHHIILQKN